MRAKPLQVHWHNKLPIFSVDFERAANSAGNVTDSGRLATAGGDNVVRLWRIVADMSDSLTARSDNTQQGNMRNSPHIVEFVASLAKHSGVVNCVRWSPKDAILASAGDGFVFAAHSRPNDSLDGTVLLWKQSEVDPTAGKCLFGDADEGQKENWIVFATLGGVGCADIYDISWSPDGQHICTGSSIDNTARVWNVGNRRLIHSLNGHSHFVQGVVWDPLNKFIATQSSDRSVVFYHRNRQDKWAVSSRSSRLEKKDARGDVEKQIEEPVKTTKSYSKLFHDETLVSFFRRLSFSPDGLLLAAPAGIVSASGEVSDIRNAVLLYGRSTNFRHPIACLSGFTRPAVVIRFNPNRYAKRGSGGGYISLPYRMIFAVGTQDSVLIFDTEQRNPFALISCLHYATITDLTWSVDGTNLIVSSVDGFCSIVQFNSQELGQKVEFDTTVANQENTLMADGSETLPSGGASLQALSVSDCTLPVINTLGTAFIKRRVTPLSVRESNKG